MDAMLEKRVNDLREQVNRLQMELDLVKQQYSNLHRRVGDMEAALVDAGLLGK